MKNAIKINYTYNQIIEVLKKICNIKPLHVVLKYYRKFSQNHLRAIKLLTY